MAVANEEFEKVYHDLLKVQAEIRSIIYAFEAARVKRGLYMREN